MLTASGDALDNRHQAAGNRRAVPATRNRLG